MPKLFILLISFSTFSLHLKFRVEAADVTQEVKLVNPELNPKPQLVDHILNAERGLTQQLIPDSPAVSQCASCMVSQHEMRCYNNDSSEWQRCYGLFHTEVSILNLMGVAFNRLSKQHFEGLGKIKFLILDETSVWDVADTTFGAFQTLRLLSLRFVKDGIMKYLPAVYRSPTPILNIDLSGDFQHCDCTFVYTLETLANSNVAVIPSSANPSCSEEQIKFCTGQELSGTEEGKEAPNVQNYAQADTGKKVFLNIGRLDVIRPQFVGTDKNTNETKTSIRSKEVVASNKIHSSQTEDGNNKDRPKPIEMDIQKIIEPKKSAGKVLTKTESGSASSKFQIFRKVDNAAPSREVSLPKVETIKTVDGKQQSENGVAGIKKIQDGSQKVDNTNLASSNGGISRYLNRADSSGNIQENTDAELIKKMHGPYVRIPNGRQNNVQFIGGSQPNVQVVRGHPPVQVIKESQPSVEVIEPNQPQVEVIRENQPQVEVIRNNQPQVEVIRNNQPQVEVIRNNQPQVEVIRDNQPQVEVIKQSEPQVEIIKENQPQIQVIKESQPKIEVLKETQPNIQVIKESPPQVEVINESPAEVQVFKGNQPAVEVIKESQPQVEVIRGHQPQIEVIPPSAPEIEVIKEEPPQVEVINEGPEEVKVIKQPPPEYELVKQKLPEIEVQPQDPEKISIIQRGPAEIEIIKQRPPEVEIIKQRPPEIDLLQNQPELEVIKEEQHEVEVIEDGQQEIRVIKQPQPEVQVIPQPQPIVEFITQGYQEVDVITHIEPQVEIIKQPQPKVEIVEEAPKVELVKNGSNDIQVIKEMPIKVSVVTEEPTQIIKLGTAKPVPLPSFMRPIPVNDHKKEHLPWYMTATAAIALIVLAALVIVSAFSCCEMLFRKQKRGSESSIWSGIKKYVRDDRDKDHLLPIEDSHQWSHDELKSPNHRYQHDKHYDDPHEHSYHGSHHHSSHHHSGHGGRRKKRSSSHGTSSSKSSKQRKRNKSHNANSKPSSKNNNSSDNHSQYWREKQKNVKDSNSDLEYLQNLNKNSNTAWGSCQVMLGDMTSAEKLLEAVRTLQKPVSDTLIQLSDSDQMNSVYTESKHTLPSANQSYFSLISHLESKSYIPQLENFSSNNNSSATSAQEPLIQNTTNNSKKSKVLYRPAYEDDYDADEIGCLFCRTLKYVCKCKCCRQARNSSRQNLNKPHVLLTKSSSTNNMSGRGRQTKGYY